MSIRRFLKDQNNSNIGYDAPKGMDETKSKIRLGTGGDLQFEQLKLTAEELERYGPSLLLDHRGGTGQRVLVWTQ